MSRIERIELYHVNVPSPAAFYPSWIPGYPQTANKYTLIKLFTDDGLMGLAAGNAFAAERQGLGDLLGSFLLGMRADDIQAVRQRIREASYLGWRNSWLENAFWDLLGKIEGKPVYNLLQPEEQTVQTVKVYASSGELQPFAKRAKYLDDIRSKGISAMKLRVKDPAMQHDWEILRDVRREVGDDFYLGVDANQGWPVSLIDPSPIWDLSYALEFGKRCDEFGLNWLEEPLDMHDWEGMAKLRKEIQTPLAGGELHGAWHEILPLFEHESLDKYQPDSTFSGLSVARMVMDECRKRSLEYSPHTWTNGLGSMVNLHAFAAWGGGGYLEYPYEPPGVEPVSWAGVMPPLELNADGTLNVPQQPGLGIELDERLLSKYGKRFYVATPLRVAVKTIREKGLKTALQLKKKRKEAMQREDAGRNGLG